MHYSTLLIYVIATKEDSIKSKFVVYIFLIDVKYIFYNVNIQTFSLFIFGRELITLIVKLTRYLNEIFNLIMEN